GAADMPARTAAADRGWTAGLRPVRRPAASVRSRVLEVRTAASLLPPPRPHAAPTTAPWPRSVPPPGRGRRIDRAVLPRGRGIRADPHPERCGPTPGPSGLPPAATHRGGRG